MNKNEISHITDDLRGDFDHLNEFIWKNPIAVKESRIILVRMISSLSILEKLKVEDSEI